MMQTVSNFPSKQVTPQFVDGAKLDNSTQRNSRISVCHIAVGSEWAGAESQLTTLISALVKSSEISVHVIVLYDRRLARELRAAGADVYIAQEQDKSFPSLISECSRFVESRGIQILHSHNYKENIISAALSYICKVPHLVRTEHGIAEPYSVLRNLKHWCVLVADRFAARFMPTRIIAVSSDLAKYWKKRTNPKNVMVLRNGVDLERITSELTATEAKERLGISSDCFVVGIGARLEGIKRFDLFVSTAAYVAKKLPNSKFIIAGGGRQEQWLRQLIIDSGLQDRVIMLGARNDVYDVLRAMDVLLICSDHEGVPMVMLEAMALGTAVVSRKVGGIIEVIDDRRTGILVPQGVPEALGDACLELHASPEFRTALVQSAQREIHEGYSAQKNAESVLQLYRSLCCADGSPTPLTR